MNVTTSANPYDTAATPLSTSYTAPTTTTDFTSDVNFSQIFGNVVTPDQVREFYRMYLGRDPGPNQYVMQFVNSGKTLGQIEQEVMNSAEAQNFAITGTPVSSAEELSQITAERNAVTPEKVRGFYQQYLGRDPGNNEFVMGWVNSGMSLADVEAQIAASQEAQNFAGMGVAAVTPPPADITADITQTVADTSNITGTTANEDGVPVGDTGLTSTQAALLAIEEREAAEAAEAAAAAAAAQSPANTFTNLLGSVQNPSSVKKQEDTPRMSFENMYKTGFATGGIVGLTDGMSLEANSGQGLESFLRSRSKAALRRNLAKVAPQPTMQRGIMPMAR